MRTPLLWNGDVVLLMPEKADAVVDADAKQAYKDDVCGEKQLLIATQKPGYEPQVVDIVDYEHCQKLAGSQQIAPQREWMLWFGIGQRQQQDSYNDNYLQN